MKTETVKNPIKSYTDLEQSKVLADIIPHVTADMILCEYEDGSWYCEEWLDKPYTSQQEHICWSLSALLNILPSASLDSSDEHYFRIHCFDKFSEWYDNPIDACVSMIVRLHELNLL